ncbi:unnamed protein product [Arctogadus glacialis]
MENSTATQTSTEVEPLKGGADKVEAGLTASQMDLKTSCREGLTFAKLSHWRTAIFFFSLFLCLTIVFAFSFVIPCPVRPQYLSTWNRTFYQAATYDFLAIEDANKDKVMDVVFVLKEVVGSQNNTCAGEGLPGPCVVAVAVAGTDGETLWERRLAPELHWAQCGLGGEQQSAGWDCLLFHSDRLTALDKTSGAVVWQRSHPPGPSSTLPVLLLPDLDGDGVGEVALVCPGSPQTQVWILSGRTGEQLGASVGVASVGVASTGHHLLHTTDEGVHLVLLQRETGLYGVGLWSVANQAREGLEAGLKEDRHWDTRANAPFDLVPVYTQGAVREVVRTGSPQQPSSLLLVAGGELVLLDGDKLQRLWGVNTSGVLRTPSFGHFDKDGVPDVVVEQDGGNGSRRLVVLSGASGARLWEVSLLPGPECPPPASVLTLTSVSVFMFWGLLLPAGNRSVAPGDCRSYMLHPLHPSVLMETPNTMETPDVMEHILAFRATLLERGRHACYFLLTEGGGGVMLRKRKLKEDVVISRVHRLSVTTETDETVKQAFSRLRFSDE